MLESSEKVAVVLRRLAESLGLGTPAALTQAGESVLVPADADVRVEYERGGGPRELVVRVIRGLAAGAAYLIHTHGDCATRPGASTTCSSTAGS